MTTVRKAAAGVDARPRRYATPAADGRLRARRKSALFATAACAFAVPLAAHAQSGSYFDRDHNVSVLQRPRPDYDALGVNVGAFSIFPQVTAAPQYDDNIFATSGNRKSDLVTAFQPSVRARSNWSRNEVDVSAQETSNVFASHSEEDTNDYNLSGSGRYDLFTSSNVNGGLSYGSYTIARTAENNITDARAPVQYSLFSANAGALQSFNRYRVSESFSYGSTSYSNAVAGNGQSLQLNLLDSDQYSASVMGAYALTPDLAVFVSGGYNDRVYKVVPSILNRSSHGYETTIGADFDITHLVRGQVQIGYLQQTYKSSQFRSVQGPAVHVRVEYFPTDLTTVTARVDRTVVDAVDPTAISYLVTQASLRVDHELLRNLLLSAQVSYENAEFRGVARNDNRPGATVSATYLFNRNLGLTAAYSFLDETSSGLQHISPYSVNLVSLSLVLRL